MNEHRKAELDRGMISRERHRERISGGNPEFRWIYAIRSVPYVRSGYTSKVHRIRGLKFLLHGSEYSHTAISTMCGLVQFLSSKRQNVLMDGINGCSVLCPRCFS